MKKLLIVALLALCACSEEATVLGNDGTTIVATCGGGSAWAKCMHDACHDGFDVVREPSFTNEGILKCKP